MLPSASVDAVGEGARQSRGLVKAAIGGLLATGGAVAVTAGSRWWYPGVVGDGERDGVGAGRGVGARGFVCRRGGAVAEGPAARRELPSASVLPS